MAGLGRAIHVFAARIKERRGWPAPDLRLAFAGAGVAGHDDGGCSHCVLGALIVERILGARGETSASIGGDDTPCRHPRETGDPAWVPGFAGMTARVAVRAPDASIIGPRNLSGFTFGPHSHG
jgi:hypothetical protein